MRIRAAVIKQPIKQPRKGLEVEWSRGFFSSIVGAVSGLL